MSWESKTAPRRRQNSSAASGRSRGLSLHLRNASKAGPGAPNSSTPPVKIDPKSAHTSDPFLQSFLNPAFDAAEYLNGTLPALLGSSSSLSSSLRSSSALSSSSTGAAAAAAAVLPLAELSTEVQTLLTQLNAHTTRLTGTLSQLTDDILRSGSRLAYEVELLRGEAIGLSEALAEEGPLRADLERFAPGLRAAAAADADGAAARRPSLMSNGVLVPPTPAPGAAAGENSPTAAPITPAAATATTTAATTALVEKKSSGSPGEVGSGDEEPPYISHLRTLTLVRARLDAVIKTFGEAMEFVFPPSEISVSSGFLSVSAPDFPDRHSSTAEQISMEDRGQQVLKKLREEISGLLRGGASHEERIKGVEAATRRVEEIKTLNTVWKGTAEEKGRQRFVESLARMVEERHRELVRELESLRERDLHSRKEDSVSRREQAGSSETTTTESRGPLGGYGFMNQWQKIRGGL